MFVRDVFIGFFFFFQAEDGIRDGTVTGVQTCALPISRGVAVVTTPPGERHGLPALMATASLREDRWLVHHLATDLPAAEVTGLAVLARASLVVLSSATTEGAQRGGEAAEQIMRSADGLRVLAGRPGDTLSQLQQLARAATARPAEA